MSKQYISETLTKICKLYPPELVEHMRRDIERMEFHIGLAMEGRSIETVQELSVCDLGGGNTLFSVGFAAFGVKRSILVDDLSDPDNDWIFENDTSPHAHYGVQIFQRDLLQHGLDGIEDQLDVVTCFNSMEHWHNSPKKLFAEVFSKLRAGGKFILSAPNGVNLRKRITVPFGRGKWSALDDWYESERFRGHVREPDVEDIVCIARSMGLIDLKVLGRNWSGYYSQKPLIRAMTVIADQPLRLFPTLCADIYVVGRKPG